MKNALIASLEGADLRAQVQKVLRGLGHPEPPLHLDDVRELLRLDRQYYSSTDDSTVREFVSKLKIAGRQILDRPTLLLDVIRKAQLSALWIPDRKRILIDAETPKLKQRWYETHEIGHSLAPWHRDFLYGDSEETLTPMCREQLESEANYTAGQLLFLADRFVREAREVATSLESVRALAKSYGNTITSTLWRFVEEAHHDLPLVGLVSPSLTSGNTHPNHSYHPSHYCIESPAFKVRFPNVSEGQLLGLVDTYRSHRRGGPVGDAEIVLADRNGGRHVFLFESFSNGYSLLTLGVYIRPVVALVAVPVSTAAV